MANVSFQHSASSQSPSHAQSTIVQTAIVQRQKLKQQNAQVPNTPPLTLPKQTQKFSWTFLFGKTSREWLNIIAAFAIPIVVVAATLIFNNQQAIQQTITNKAQHDSDAQIAQDQQRETTLNTYFHDVEGLLLDRGLQTSKKGDEVRVTARIETLLALQRLDGNRRGLLMQFLSEAKLVTGQDVVIDLTGAELANAYLFVLVLRGARLDFVDLQDAVLKNAHLQNIHLKGSHLQGADLRGADLQGADLRGAHMFTDLKGIRLFANLSGANLSGANLAGAHMQYVNLQYANLKGANLNFADLKGANLNFADLEGATMPDGSLHP